MTGGLKDPVYMLTARSAEKKDQKTTGNSIVPETLVVVKYSTTTNYKFDCTVH